MVTINVVFKRDWLYIWLFLFNQLFCFFKQILAIAAMGYYLDMSSVIMYVLLLVSSVQNGRLFRYCHCFGVPPKGLYWRWSSVCPLSSFSSVFGV